MRNNTGNNRDASIQRVKKALLSQQRVVTIWGAGASIPSGIPGGSYIISRMVKDLRALGLMQNSEEKTQSMEEVLSIYEEQYKSEGLHEWLRQFIPEKKKILKESPPFFPAFAHEYCAHLVSNGLLKYFISLNFDEILELAMEEELGAGQFQVVASIDEFQRLNNKSLENWGDEFGDPAPRCFVFKPHGTVSKGRTLCYLPKQTETFGKEKGQVLTTILKDALVIFLGFGNYNKDFRILFGETYSRDLTDDIVIVDKNPKEPIKGLSGNRHTKEIFRYRGSVNDFFEELAEAIHSDRKYASYRNRPIRHQIRGLFFDLFSRELAKEDDEPEYRARYQNLRSIPRAWFDMRIYELELLIYLVKTRGLFIQLAAAECHRVSSAFKRCIEWKGSGDLKEDIVEPEKVLEKVLDLEGNPKIYDYVPVQDRTGEEALNTYWCFLLAPDQTENETSEKLFENVCRKIASRYSGWLENKLKENLRDANGEWVYKRIASFQRNLSDRLIELYNYFDVDIFGPDVLTAMRFPSAEPIKSRQDFSKRTKSLGSVDIQFHMR